MKLDYLPIYEKENAFDYLEKYDKIAAEKLSPDCARWLTTGEMS